MCTYIFSSRARSALVACSLHEVVMDKLFETWSSSRPSGSFLDSVPHPAEAIKFRTMSLLGKGSCAIDLGILPTSISMRKLDCTNYGYSGEAE
jgi:hypothetical protein